MSVLCAISLTGEEGGTTTQNQSWLVEEAASQRSVIAIEQVVGRDKNINAFDTVLAVGDTMRARRRTREDGGVSPRSVPVLPEVTRPE